MPLYSYRRPDGTIVERKFPMNPGPPRTIVCEDGVEAVRDMVADAKAYSGAKGDIWPIHSEVCGIDPSQIAEAKKKFPHHEYDSQGRMVFRSRKHMVRCLRDIGFTDRRSYTM